MSGIYIPNMKLPKEDDYKYAMTLVVLHDGTVLAPLGKEIGRAIELPPHGDLIDRSKIVYAQDDSGFRTMAYARRAQLENVIPVIPADPEGGADG